MDVPAFVTAGWKIKLGVGLVSAGDLVSSFLATIRQ